MQHAEIAIIGSGIVGLSCAFYLQRAGHDCLLIDSRGFGQEASFGNAGALSFANVFPQATPGVAWQGLRMLLDRDAPLKLDFAAWTAWMGWLRRFVRAGRADRVEAIIPALHAINAISRSAWLELARSIDAHALLEETGYLHLYSEAANFTADAWKRERYERLGIRYRVLDASQLHELEPNLGDGFVQGVLQEDALALRDPGAFCQRLGAALVEQGAGVVRARAQRIKRDAGGYQIDTDHGQLTARRIVLATGSRINELLRGFAPPLPVIAGRGYHLMYPAQHNVLQRPMLWLERYIVLSPMNTGIRLAGLKDLTRPDRAPRFRFIERRQADARHMLPALQGEPVSAWHGDRPLTPDSLPIIDRLDNGGMFLATGHGHLGMTQGPATGKLIAEMVDGSGPSIALHPYRHTRFS